MRSKSGKTDVSDAMVHVYIDFTKSNFLKSRVFVLYNWEELGINILKIEALNPEAFKLNDATSVLSCMNFESFWMSVFLRDTSNILNLAKPTATQNYCAIVNAYIVENN